MGGRVEFGGEGGRRGMRMEKGENEDGDEKGEARRERE